MLSAQLFNREGETYVRVSILNRSGNTGSRVVPTPHILLQRADPVQPHLPKRHGG